MTEEQSMRIIHAQRCVRNANDLLVEDDYTAALYEIDSARLLLLTLVAEDEHDLIRLDAAKKRLGISDATG